MRLLQAFKKSEKLLPVLLMVLTVLIMSTVIHADSNNNGSADNNKPKVDMIDGNLVFDITSKAASNKKDPRYRTIGYTISLKPQNKEVSAKGITGPDAPPTPNGYVALEDSYKETIKDDGKTNITRFTIPKEVVRAKLYEASGLDIDNLSKTTTIYLHAAFETYIKENDDNSADKGKIRKTGLRTWKDIVNAEQWGAPEIFERYFNIPVTFDPGEQPVEVFYQIWGENSSTSLLKFKPQEINKAVGWDGIVQKNISREDKTYTLMGYYVTNRIYNDDKDKDKYIEVEVLRKIVGGTYDNKKLTADDIINKETAKVLYGGINIYMIYKRIPTIIINAVELNTKFLKNLYTGAGLPGERITKNVDYNIEVDGFTYERTKYYQYTRSDYGIILK